MTYDNVVYSNSNANTRIMPDNLAGGAAPELLLSGKKGAKDTWIVTINDLKGCHGVFTLSLYTNNDKLKSVKVNDTNVSLSASKKEKGLDRTATFTVNEGTTSLKLEFTPSDNTRIDNVVLTAPSAGESKTATTLFFDTTENAFKVFKGSESSFTAPKAIVKDADGKVVEGAKITYTSSNSNIASVAENGKVTFGSEFGTATITASYAGDATYKPASSNYTIIYSKIPTFMAWSESVVNVNLGETFTAPTLTFTAHGVNLEGKTIQYSSSDETVATIDQTNGEITLKDKAGSTTITATFAGDDTHDKVSAEYTLNVIDPNKTDVTFDFTDPEKYGYKKPTTTTPNITLSDGDKLVSSSVTITNVKGGNKITTRFFDKRTPKKAKNSKIEHLV